MVAGKDDDGPVTVRGNRLLQHQPALEPWTPLADNSAVEFCPSQQTRAFLKIRTGFYLKPVVVQHPGILVTISWVFIDKQDSGTMNLKVQFAYPPLRSDCLHIQPPFWLFVVLVPISPVVIRLLKYGGYDILVLPGRAEQSRDNLSLPVDCFKLARRSLLPRALGR